MTYRQSKGPRPAEKPEDVLMYAVFLLSRRDYSEQGMREKLPRKTERQDWIDSTMVRLKELGYMDDQRFCRSFVLSARNKGHGPRRIMQDLQRKGVDKDLVEEELAGYGDDSHERAKALLDKKMPYPLEDRKQRDKAGRFLVSRGFGFDAVRYATEHHLRDVED